MRTQSPFDKHLQELSGVLRRLPHKRQLAFAAACCERAFPNYVLFSREEGWGNSAYLRRALDRAWSVVAGDQPTVNELEELRKLCYSVIPDSEDFPSGFATAAQEAGVMALHLLQFCADDDTTCAVRIASLARDTIDLYVNTEGIPPGHVRIEWSTERAEAESKAQKHPLMRSELGRQQEDLLVLQGIQQPADMLAFEARARRVTKSNIGL